MTWRTDWNAISARIASLLDAGHFFAEIMKVNASDSYGGAKVLADSAAGVFHSLDAFANRHSGSLPRPAAQRLEVFLKAYRSTFESTPTVPGQNFEFVQFRLTSLRALQSEMTYLLADTELAGRSLVERAFLHLQRAIIADRTIRNAWREAFDEGEPACEKLGAAHLLMHGIWAFKASAEGERTDLILGQRLEITAQIERASEALVLTEWKVVRDPVAELSSKADEAFRQAKMYATGSLAGFELSSSRYLIVVSKPRLEMPPDHVVGTVTYQYVNVPVEPAVPSVESKKKA